MVRELRTCPVTGRVALINESWPDPLPAVVPPPGVCWFCETPSDHVLARRADWRVVPHPVPALGIEGDVRARVDLGRVRRDAVGAHELIFAGHDGAAHQDALRLVIQRIGDLRRDTRLRGFRAIHRAIPGHHVVWQLFALPFELAPSAPASWRDGELRDRERVVAESPEAVGLAAWAPRQPFELWVLPRTGRSRLEVADTDPVAELAEKLASRVSQALRGAPVDWVIEDGEPYRIELVPRVAPAAALEVAAGVPLHGVRPELAAGFLRDRASV